MLKRTISYFIAAAASVGAALQTDSQICMPEIYSVTIAEDTTRGGRGIGVIDENTILTTSPLEVFLRSVDISDLTDSAVLDEVFSNGETEILVRGDYAYIHHPSRVRVADISDPNSIEVLGAYTAGSTDSLHTDSEAAFVGDDHLAIQNRTKSSSFEIIDISDPSNPTLAAIHDIGSSVRSLASRNNYLYISSDDLLVFDMSDPLNPVKVNRLDSPAEFLTAEGSYLYSSELFPTSTSSLAIYDLSDPANPALISETPFLAYPIAVHGNKLAAKSTRTSIAVCDISDPNNITVTQVIALPESRVFNLAFAGEKLIGSSPSKNEIFVYDTGAKIADTPVVTSPGSFPSGAIIADELAYSMSGSTLSIHDVSEPTAPLLIADHTLDTPGSFFDIKGDRLVVASSYTGVQLIDVSDPSAPQTLNTFTVADSDGEPGRVVDVAIDEDSVYTIIEKASNNDVSELAATDISDPKNPAQAALNSTVFEFFGDVYRIAAKDDAIYIQLAILNSQKGRFDSYIYKLNRSAYDQMDFVSAPISGFSGLAREFRVVGDSLFFACGSGQPSQNHSGVYLGSRSRSVQAPRSYWFYGPGLGENIDLRYNLVAADTNGEEFFIALTEGRVLRYDTRSGRTDSFLGAYQLQNNITDLYVVGDTLVINARNTVTIDLTACENTCIADVNDDGQLDSSDYYAWIAAYIANSLGCDQNGDGACTPTDFTAWVANFNAGC